MSTRSSRAGGDEDAWGRRRSLRQTTQPRLYSIESQTYHWVMAAKPKNLAEYLGRDGDFPSLASPGKIGRVEAEEVPQMLTGEGGRL
jgi:hypothetical protein